MSSDSRISLAGYRCTECGEIRAYGSKPPDQRLSRFDRDNRNRERVGMYDPLLSCSSCQKPTRHESIGFVEFSYMSEQRRVNGVVVMVNVILPFRERKARGQSTGGTVQ